MPIRKSATKKSEKDFLFDDRDVTGVKTRRRTTLSVFDEMDEETGSYSSNIYTRAQRAMMSKRRLPYVELYERVGRILTGVVGVMTPRGVKRPVVSYDPEKSFCDGKNIWIAVQPLKDMSLDSLKAIDVCAGLGVHEMCHICYTNWQLMSDIIPKLETIARTKGEEIAKMYKYLDNVIEDEMIERKCVDEFPGYSNFLVAPKVYFFDKIDATPPKDLPHKVFRELFHLIRFPERLSEDNLIDIEEEKPGLWRKVCDHLQPYPTDSAGAWNATVRIMKELESTFTAAELKNSGIQKESSESEAEGFTAGSPLTMEDKKNLINKLLAAISSVMTSGDINQLKELEDNIIELREFKDCVTGINRKVTFKKIRGRNKPAYEGYVKALRPLKGTLSRLLRTESVDTNTLHKGMRSGALDASKLVEARQRVETVYTKKTHSKSAKHTIVILIDQSYSMHSPISGGSEKKIAVAKKTAMLLYEAIKGQPDLDVYMYGHTADHEGQSTLLYVYEEPGFSAGGLNLVEAGEKSNNRDGVALQAVVDRVRMFTDKHAMLFLIADGMPYASGYEGTSSVKHVRQVVNYAEKRNIDVIGVSIDSHYSPKDMFKHFIPFSSIRSVPKQLSTVVLKQVRKHRKIIVT